MEPLGAPAWIVIGLSNPGRFAGDKRHNVGALIVDAMAGPLAVFDRAGLSLVRRTELGPLDALLAKPQTYMDRCGGAVRALVDTHGVRPENVVVLHDDPDLAFGFLRVRTRGAHGGHAGMKAVMAALHPAEVPRIRIGIAREGSATAAGSDDLTDLERARLAGIGAAVAAAIGLLAQGQAEKSMSLFNRRDKPVDAIMLPRLAARAG